MRAIDLFAGAGGLSLGLRQAGIDVVAAIERDPDACSTYRANLGDHMIQANIEDVDAHALPDCDLIAGGPPCQGFSYAGKRDPNDPRNRLWREYWRIVEAKRPAWILLENVRGMLSMGEDKPLILAFRALGYEVTPYLLNAADYGVPQKRLRVFYVGNRIGAANPCPTPTHAQPPRHLLLGLEPWVTVRQALGIGGQMTHKFGSTVESVSGSCGDPWFDGDTEPARVVNTLSMQVMDGILDEPSRALRAGAHGQPGYSPRHLAGYVPEHDPILDHPSSTIRFQGGGHDTSPSRMAARCPVRPQGWIPNIPLDAPSPTIQGGGTETGGAEPVRHRLRGRWAEHGEGSTVDEPSPTVSADRGLEQWTLRGRASGDGDGQTLDEPALTIPAQWSVDVVDPELGRRTYTDAEGRQHTRPGNAAILRRLTVRECATLQDFPPDVAFCGSKTSQYRQVGNAVAVGMARALGRAIRDADARCAPLALAAD